MMNAFYQTSLVSIDQINWRSFNELCELADQLRVSHQLTLINQLKGLTSVNLFYEPSTRTSSSFYSAMTKLGGSVIPINEVSYSSVTKGESLEDTIRTLGSYSDVIILRHSEVGAASRATSVSSVPIINAGDGIGEHPTQALLDLYTIIREKKQINGLTIAFMGDLKHGRTVHSLMKLLSTYDITPIFISPIELQLPDEYKKLFLNKEEHYTTHDLKHLMRKIDVLYVTRVQTERFSATEPMLVTTDFRLTKELMAEAKDDMIVMHPLPRVTEIDPEIDSDPRAAYFRQVTNGLWIRMALLKLTLTES